MNHEEPITLRSPATIPPSEHVPPGERDRVASEILRVPTAHTEQVKAEDVIDTVDDAPVTARSVDDQAA